MPLPSARPIHPAWSALGRKVTDRMQNATVHIYIPGTATGWSTESGTTTTGGTDLYTGRARVMPRPTQAAQADAAGQPVVARTYTVSIPTTADVIRVGAAIQVTAVDANADPTLASARLHVIDVAPGSYAWERVLVAVLDETNQGA